MPKSSFALPDNSCRGTDFWMLNDKLDPSELRRQLRQLNAQGIKCVIARTYIGLRSDYPGPEFMHNMKVVIDEARKLDMHIFMQAGYMPEAVLDMPESFSLGDVSAHASGTGTGIVLCSHNGVDYCLSPSGRILDMLNPEACRFYVKQSYEDMWADFKPEFGNVIESVWVDEPSYAKATLPWTAMLPDAFKSLWGYGFPIERIYLLFEPGEGASTLRYHYWRTVLHLIKTAYFSEVRTWCHANGVLFSGHLMAEDTMASQLHATCFTMPLYQYFDMPGIDYLTAAMNWRHGEIKPEHTGESDGQTFAQYITPLQCASAAHQNGQERVLAEIYGVSSENLTLRDQKHMFDHFAALGINHRSVHGVFYSLHGRGKRAYPPHVNAYQPYWPEYHNLTDAITRESWFLRQGKPVRDVLLLHPMDSAFCEYRARGIETTPDNSALNRRDLLLLHLVRTLAGKQYNFELGDEDSIAQTGAVNNGRFQIGEMAYRTVVLPDMLNMRHTTLELLTAFDAAGGSIIVLGNAPHMLDGYETDAVRANLAALKHVHFAANMAELCTLLDACEQSYSYNAFTDSSRLFIHYRECGNTRLFFFANSDCARAAQGEVTIPGECAVQLMSPQSGSIAECPCVHAGHSTNVNICVEPGGSLLLKLAPGSARADAHSNNATVQISLANEWALRRDNPNALVLEFCRFAKGDGALEGPYPVIAVQEQLEAAQYNGEITLEYEFETGVTIAGAKLALEDAALHALWLDDIPVSSAPDGQHIAFAFQTVSLPDIAPGRHILRAKRHFEPLRKAKMAVTSLFENLGGVELEPPVLLGEFAVRSAIEPGVWGCVRMNPHFKLARERNICYGEVVREGYPFYAGTITLSKTIALTLEQLNGKLCFELDDMDACAIQVRVNGIDAGILCWSPYSVDITGLVQVGENTVELTLYNSLRNLLGPWHRPGGEIGACWGGYEFPNMPWSGVNEDGKLNPEWYNDRVPDRPGWTESYLLLPLGIHSPRIAISAANQSWVQAPEEA